MKIKEYREIATNIMSLYSEMDKLNEEFSQASSLSCVTTCGGVCCKNTDVEVSPVDLLPLALKILDTNQVEEYLELCDSNSLNHCVFYKEGKCSTYKERATLCRLFGFSANYDKKGEKVLSICSFIKAENSPTVTSQVLALAPSIVDYSGKVNNQLPHWDSQALPFNQALSYALTRVCLSDFYEQKSSF